MSYRFVPCALVASAFLIATHASAAHAQANATVKASIDSIPAGYAAMGDVEYVDQSSPSSPSSGFTLYSSPQVSARVLRSDGSSHNSESAYYKVTWYFHYTGTGTPPGAQVSGVVEAFGNCANDTNQPGADYSSAFGFFGNSVSVSGSDPDNSFTSFSFDDPKTWTATWANGASVVSVQGTFIDGANSDPE